ncbi:unnamed protein product [Bursaphelenchus okinawaensis]|uniref:SCP domain-containing protein n=1 Tax=Bursaphelenchus okinawaensis TaxID=465554 RepID=A0A811L6F3_9BILA|nr:unnamed protein product [Bursaphelenchus okinawaensis]CAG9116698.1 unnamed protein product [Bursaphelenchus okinawaensis]
MKTILFLFCLATVKISTIRAAPTTEAPGSGAVLTDDERAFAVDYHNQYRRTVATGQQAAENGNLPEAANMFQLEYDTDVEAAAQDWANNCTFGYQGYSVGQSVLLLEISSTSGINNTYFLQSAIDNWFDEVETFNVSSVSSYDGTSTMFTQIIWGNTYSVGCGVKQCSSFTNLDSTYDGAFLVVCNYQTAGNTEDQPIYTQGDTCSQCPANRLCDDSLCAINPDATTVLTTTAVPTTTEVAGSGAGLSEDERTFVVNYHNNYRRTVALGQQEGENGTLPQAANMYEFTYDTSLENLAQAWANNCTLGGGGYGAVGQNSVVYGFGGEPGINNTYVLQLSIDGWFSEVDSFNVSTVGNYQGQSSTFTQMIWATTYSVGCGVKQCATFTNLDSGWNNGFIIVCDYELVGNNQGMPIYIEGDACSQCPDDRICDNGLCAMDPNSTAQPGDDECEV